MVHYIFFSKVGKHVNIVGTWILLYVSSLFACLYGVTVTQHLQQVNQEETDV